MTINDQLFIAAQTNDIATALVLLTQGADVDAIHAVGAPPLYIAAQNGHAQMVDLLLKQGAATEFKLSNGMTALCVAAYNGHAKAVEALLNWGADTEEHVGTTTVIHLAAQNGHREVVRLLLKNGASLENGANVASKEQNMLEILLQQGDHRIKKIGCYDALSKEIFAQEGIDYEIENKSLMEDSSYRVRHIKDYTIAQKIPLITHQIYFTSKENPRAIDDLSLNKTILSAQRLSQDNSNWKHYIWTDNPQIIPKSLTDISGVEIHLVDELEGSLLYPELKGILEDESNKTKYVEASDLTRIMVVNKFGGIYHDLDYEIYKPEKLLALTKAFDFVGGKELATEPTAIGNAFIASIPAHPILSETIALLKRNLNVEQSAKIPEYIKFTCTKWHDTWYKTSPPVITMAVYKAANNGTVDVILPSNVLYNVDYARYNAPGSRCYDPKKIVTHLDKETIGADMFCGSWSANENFLNFFYYPKNNDAYLYEASMHGYTRIVDYFLTEKRANINALVENAATALHIAVENKHVETVQYLLDHGAKTEIQASNGLTALCIAVQNKHTEITKMLIEMKADIECKFPSGATALYVAAYLGDRATFLLLLSAGAKKDVVVNGLNIFQMATQNGHVEIAQMLMPEILSSQLFYAALNGQTTLVDSLLKAGADIEFAVDGHTPIYAAIYNGHIETTELLLKNNASIEDNLRRYTPMFIAASKGLNKQATDLHKAVYKLVQDYYWTDVEKAHQAVQTSQVDLEVVVARYNEDVSWLKHEFPTEKVTIYNKGGDITDIADNWVVVNMPNVGLDPSAYLTHIVNNYNNLTDRVLFVQGVPYDHPVYLPLSLYKGDLVNACDNIIAKCENTSIKAEWDAISYTLATKGWDTYDNGKYSNVVKRDYSFLEYIDKFICKYPLETEFHINWGTEFAVDTKVIMNHPVEYYQAILDTLDISFPIEVHYLERLFDLVFQECPYKEVEVTGEVAI